MKISNEQFNALNKGLIDTLKAHNLHPFMVNNDNLAWDVFHKAWNEKRIDGNELYKTLNDANILSAMRKIFKANQRE